MKKGKVKKYYVKKLRKEDKTPIELANFLKEEKADVIINNKLNSLIYYNLRKVHHILIYPNFSDLKNVKQTLKILTIDI